MKNLFLIIFFAVCSFNLIIAETDDEETVVTTVKIIDYGEDALHFDYVDSAFDNYDKVTLLFIKENITVDFYIPNCCGLDDSNIKFWNDKDKVVKVSVKKSLFTKIANKPDSTILFISNIEIVD